VLLGLLITAGLVGCAAARARERDRPYTAGLAQVERIEVTALRSRPPQAWLVATGRLPDACTQIDRIDQDRRGYRLELTMTTRRYSGACVPGARPFERKVTLNVQSLPSGLYVVTINGVSDTFLLVGDPVDDDRHRGGELE
jgi:inhibitor of cysteine peptidase